MALPKPWLNPLKARVGWRAARAAPSGFVLKNRGWFLVAGGEGPRGSTRQPQAWPASGRLTADSLEGPAGICCCCMEFHALLTANEPIGVLLERRWRKMSNSHDQWGECR